MAIALVLSVLIICICIAHVYSSNNERKQYETFWGRDKNEVDLNPILDELNDLKCAIHRQAGQIKEAYSGIQKIHERLNKLEDESNNNNNRNSQINNTEFSTNL